MAKDYQNIAAITSALDDYQRNLERRRQSMDISGTGTTSNPYKSYTVFEDGREVTKVLTPTEARSMYPEGIPKKGSTEVKTYSYKDPVTEQENEIIYTDAGLNQYFAQNNIPYNQENLNKYFSDSSKGLVKSVGTYDKTELEELQQELFTNYAYQDANGNNIKSNPVTSDEAKLVLDMKTILEDYKDYSKDDMILSSENIRRRYDEINALYNEYVQDRAEEKDLNEQSSIKPSKLKYLRKKLDDLETRWTTVKTDSFKGGAKEGVVYTGFDRPSELKLEENLKGKDKAEFEQFKYFNKLLDEKGIVTVPIDGVDFTFNVSNITKLGDEQFKKFITDNFPDVDAKKRVQDKVDFFNLPEIDNYFNAAISQWDQYRGLNERWSWYTTAGAKPPSSQPDLVKKYGKLKDEPEAPIDPDDPYGLNLGGDNLNPLNLNLK